MILIMFIFRIWYFDNHLIFLLWQIISTLVFISFFIMIGFSFFKKTRKYALFSVLYLVILILAYFATDFALQMRPHIFGQEPSSLPYLLKNKG